MMKYPFSIIAAVDQHYGIGKEGTLPWHLSGDLRHFKEVTCRTTAEFKKNALIMGRKTWESLPLSLKPLPERINCVVSRNAELILPEGVVLADSFPLALRLLIKRYAGKMDKIFVIGGAEIFNEALRHPDWERLIMTFIRHDFHCDVFFKPDLSSLVKERESAVVQEKGLEYYFVEYVKNR